MSKVDLKNYVCMVPFSSLEIHDKKRFLCCASWLKKYLPESTSPKDAWESDDAYDIRESVLDGSYKYCDKEQCPFLSQLLNFGEIGNTQTLVLKKNISDDFKKRIKEHKNKTLKPVTIQFSFDRTCNLKCPSCRINIFTADKKKIEDVKLTIDEIQSQYGDSVKTLYITGSGDPFISVGFRDFLKNFDKSKWPNLNRIHLHTNATKWNKKMWDSMSNIHPYVKTCEISIDAATKDTYENKVRLGGNWDELIDNLKFISTIPTLKSVKTSFVVQTSNYKEMRQFYDLMYSIFGNKLNVFFGKITNWGTFTNDEYKEHKVWDESHPFYNDFVNEVNSFILNDKIWHNLQEFLSPQKKII
jgi:organic radical activating enzyme